MNTDTMSHELLVLAGAPTPSARELRRRVLDHAIDRVPRVLQSSRFESATAVSALVATAPEGGSLTSVGRDHGGLRLTLATGERGLVAAREQTRSGAEAGHVSVLLRDDGDVVLSTDGVGFLPCYWGRSGTTLAISTHLASLVSLGVPATPDDQGVVEYVTTQSPIGVRTLLRGATLLVAGGTLRWAPDRWTPPRAASAFAPADDTLPTPEAISAFARIWPEIVADAFSGSGRTVMGLSGGLDSRAIAEAAVLRGFRPMTYTYGLPPSREPVVAGTVAGVLGLPNVRIPVSRERLLVNATDALDLLDGAHSPSEMYELWFDDILRDFADAVVNGNAGGPLWGDDKAFGLVGARAVVDQRLRTYAPGLAAASRYLVPELAAEAPSLLRRGLEDSLTDWDLDARPDHLIFWRVLNRQFRWGNMLTNAFRRSGIRAEAPFLDARFLALASRFSPEQRRNGHLYLRLYRELFSRTGGIPRADDGNAPHALNHVYWAGDTPYIRQLGTLTRAHPVSGARRAMRQSYHEAAVQLRRRTGLRRPADRSDGRRAVFPADVWLRSERVYADRLRELLDSGGHPLFSRPAVEAALADLRSGRASTPALVLGKVAAAQAWLADYDRRAAALRPVLTG